MKKNIVILLLFVLCMSCSVVYKFESDLKKSELIPEDIVPYKGLKGMRYHNYYGKSSSTNSVRFPELNSETWINIEHLVKLKPVDIEIIQDDDIKNTNYMFSAIEVHEDLEITEIESEHYYKGNKLETKGFYIYRLNKSENAKTKFVVEKFDGVLPISSHFILVKISKLPISRLKEKFLPRSLWFSENAKQEIMIKYRSDGEIKQKKLEFDLTWTRKEYWIT